MYPDERVVRFITENFIPVRVHVRDQAAEFQRLGERYGAQWTPTILEIGPDGTETHRVEGFVDAPELLAQLTLGLGQGAFKAKRWKDAVRLFRVVLTQHPDSDTAPEALYWAGVSRYRDTNDASALAETAAAFAKKYSDSTWAKKSSVWKK